MSSSNDAPAECDLSGLVLALLPLMALPLPRPAAPPPPPPVPPPLLPSRLPSPPPLAWLPSPPAPLLSKPKQLSSLDSPPPPRKLGGGTNDGDSGNGTELNGSVSITGGGGGVAIMRSPLLLSLPSSSCVLLSLSSSLPAAVATVVDWPLDGVAAARASIDAVDDEAKGLLCSDGCC
jgi:hypothetical protein